MGMLTTEKVDSTISITLLHLVIGSIKEVKQYRINKLVYPLATVYDTKYSEAKVLCDVIVLVWIFFISFHVIPIN